ncbi:NADPH-dependent FMN reductase [Nakamurella sp. YIM 132087]|uniref:NADPH-dependent FMN reductase n=1 Tax=Nakamurella alba TaxID=2665158 RepID=A0A7K1FRE1_9ACTN|nr:NADPH-dependent FMN reductase [Nakamurella alba]MTD16640.1 NADPH-dependent FMN reductase [Nakamurella alba]
MATVVAISGSPSPTSTSQALLRHVELRLEVAGHTVVTIHPRDLPADALLAGDSSDPQIAAAVAAVASADGIVVSTPVFKASFSGLLKTFLDLLPQFALAGRPVLPLVTGGSPAHVLVLDYALRPVLQSMGAAPVAAGWFVSSAQLRRYEDGGLVLDPAAAGPVADVTDGFLALLDGRPAPALPAPRVDRARVSPVAGAADLRVLLVGPDDPRLAGLLADLKVEYITRYAAYTPETTLVEVPPADFVRPRGTFVLLAEGDEIIAGGAIRRYDPRTAEVKRVWTSLKHRRRGLAVRLMAQLEKAAADLGYERVHLTTGPRQPEAKELYLAADYLPRFDLDAEPESVGAHAFGKELVPGAGLVAWPPVPGTDPHAAQPVPVGAAR